MVPQQDDKPELAFEHVDTPRVLAVNDLCQIHVCAEICVVTVSGFAVFHYVEGDTASERLFAGMAMAAGYASPAELAEVLSPSLSTMYRIKERYRQGGAASLVPKRGGRPRGQTLGAARERAIRRWHGQQVSGREMARRLGVTPGVVQKALRRMGLPPRTPKQTQIALPGMPQDEDEPDSSGGPATGDAGKEEATSPTESPSSAPSRPRMDVDPFDRSLDRMLAREGLLFDADPVFAPGRDLPRLGVLLALPMIVATGLLDEAKALYGTLGPAFYGLRTSLLTMVVLALLRIRHPENLKEYSPPELGRLLGLDRAPEVKTLRRKLTRLAAMGRAAEFGQELARHRVAERGKMLGFLYVDGHVRVYHGKRTIPKAYVPQIRPVSQKLTRHRMAQRMRTHPLLNSASPCRLRHNHVHRPHMKPSPGSAADKQGLLL